jgi:cellulose synthase operon protein YhjQ
VVRKVSSAQSAGSPVADTLQHSRERVAARWFALKGIFDHHGQEQAPEPTPVRQKEVRVPMLTVFSLAGGVGKTSLVATLGRALSSTGEKVLLTDTTSHGLLPFYFGASELRPGVVRTFSPPAGSSDAAIALVSYDVARNNGDTAAQELLNDELTRASRGMQRVILDLSPISPWVVKRLVRMGSMVVVPVAPDMNSVISLGPVEKFFAGMIDGDGRPVQPHYLLNQFDASLPLHLDVREVMRQQLGDRLLPFIIRRSPVVSEALAEGMTVMDYAPDAPVAGDYMNFASWLRMQSAPAASGLKTARWSER